MTRIYLLQSGIYGEGCSDFYRAFEDEETAWLYALKKWKKYNISRKNWQKQKGFRAIIMSDNRWIIIQEIDFVRKTYKE